MLLKVLFFNENDCLLQRQYVYRSNHSEFFVSRGSMSSLEELSIMKLIEMSKKRIESLKDELEKEQKILKKHKIYHRDMLKFTPCERCDLNAFSYQCHRCRKKICYECSEDYDYDYGIAKVCLEHPIC
jgi:hypothetical protein